jgi:hypothetical protein
MLIGKNFRPANPLSVPQSPSKCALLAATAQTFPVTVRCDLMSPTLARLFMRAVRSAPSNASLLHSFSGSAQMLTSTVTVFTLATGPQ